MNCIFSFEQISETGNFDAKLILRQYKIDLMASIMEIKSVNPKLKQDQLTKELGCSSCTLQRYGIDFYMFSHYRNPPEFLKRKQKISNH